MLHQEVLIKIVKERRKVLNITQETLADLAEVSLRTLKQFEAGKGNPTLNSLAKIVEVLGLEIRLDIKQNNIEA